MELTSEQCEQYRTEGYTVVRSLIPPSEAHDLRDHLLSLLENRDGWSDNHFQILNPEKHRNSRGQFIPVGVQVPAGQDPRFARIANHPNLVAAMSSLLGGPVKRFTDQAFIKSPGVEGRSFYHQDSYYWRLNPELGCNAWIALNEVGAGSSALAIMPGSHRDWTLIEHEQYFDEPSFHNASSGQAFMRWRIPEDGIDYSREVLLPMSAGDAAFFTNFTWHRAEANVTDVHRCAYAIAYQKSEA